MALGTLGAALEREHQQIGGGIDSFVTALERGEGNAMPLVQAIAALRRHIYLEEQFLFPSLRAAGLMAPVFVMVREHGEIWKTLDELEGDVNATAVNGPAAVVTCRKLAGQLEAHNTKEEQILYPQADRVMTPPASGELDAFIGSGKMPDGWVCAGARA